MSVEARVPAEDEAHTHLCTGCGGAKGAPIAMVAYQAALESYTSSSKAAASAVQVAIDDLRSKITSSIVKISPRPDTQRLDKDTILWTPGRKIKESPDKVNGFAAATDADLKPAHLRLLSAIAWWEAVGVSEPDLVGVAFVAGTSAESSAFDNNRSWLRARGLSCYPRTGFAAATQLLFPSGGY